MAIPAKFAGHILGSKSAPNTIEAYLDYLCPFSLRAYSTVVDKVMPFLEQEYPGKVKFVFRHQVQPWHPQGTQLHEAALAVEKLDSGLFYAFSSLLFQHAEEFSDGKSIDLTGKEIYQRLASLASKLNAPAVTSDLVLSQLMPGLPGQVTHGNSVTNDFKFHLKISRQNSIHVSPTFLFDGLIDSSVQSSATLDQWKEVVLAKFPSLAEGK